MILATIKQINQKQLILVQGEDSKKGQLFYLTRKGSFQVILYKMIRFLSVKLKKHTKLAKIVKISIFVNRLVFPMNFNRFSHPMTLPWLTWWSSWRLTQILWCVVSLQASILNDRSMVAISTMSVIKTDVMTMLKIDPHFHPAETSIISS